MIPLTHDPIVDVLIAVGTQSSEGALTEIAARGVVVSSIGGATVAGSTRISNLEDVGRIDGVECVELASPVWPDRTG